jgi:hypothetical protein
LREMRCAMELAIESFSYLEEVPLRMQ